MRYAIVYERAANNYSAYCPDLPGCVATGATKKETKKQIKAAIALHMQGLRADQALRRSPKPNATSRKPRT